MPDVLAGRETELEAAGRLVRGLEAGPRAMIFEGDPGIGKTTVWAEAVRRAEAECLVLSARPTKAEEHLAFAALADLLVPALDHVLTELPTPQRRAIGAACLREDPAGRGIDQRAVGAATLSILQALGRSMPVLIAIDDLPWLDRPTARTLEFALRRLKRTPVGVLACTRTNGGSRLPLDPERVLPAGRCARLRLPPLSLAAIQRIVKRRLGRSLPRRILLRVERASGGNPFFALELARILPPGASTVAALPIPESLGGLVEERVAGLPKRCRQLLLTAAALRSPTPELVLEAMPGGRAGALAALDQALETEILTAEGSRLRFAHPLFAEVLYSSAPAGERRAAHRRLARIVSETEERARHLALAAPPGPDPRVARALEEAAEHARRRGAPDVAAELAERARVLTPSGDAEARLRRSIQAASYHFHAGELRRARETLESVLEAVPSGPARASALRLLGEVNSHEQSFKEANPLFQEALEHVGDDDEARSEIELSLTYGLNVLGDFPAIAEHASRALTLAERTDKPGLVAEALAVSAIADQLLGRGIDDARVERALALEDLNREVPVEFRPSLIAGCLAIYGGNVERAERILSGLRERLLERGQEGDLPFVTSQLVWAASWRGRLGAAEGYAQESLESAARIESDAMRCIALAFAAVAAAYSGEPEQTRGRATECRELARRTGFNIALLWAGWAEALLALSLDDPGAAHAALAPLAVPFKREEVPDPARPFFLPDEIEALIALDRPEEAERLLATFGSAARRLRRPWALMRAARCRALLLAGRGDLDAASRAVADALALCDGLELRIEVARTLLCAGRIERRRRAKRSASDHLGEAATLFEGMGARLWAERARGELARVGLRRFPPDELTASERRVAELTASGLKNREVAAQLFLSPKTVEATLARVYRKLGIRSRAELGARLSGDRVPAKM